MTVDSPEFDKIMGAFAKAIDTYLKNDLKVDIDVESKGHLDITPAFTTIDPNVQLTYDLETRTTTKGNLV